MENTLPQLKGSEKQVTWAEKLRPEVIAELDRKITHEEKVLAPGPYKDPNRDTSKQEAYVEKLNRSRRAIEEITDASWWISRKSDAGGAISVNVRQYFLGKGRPLP